MKTVMNHSQGGWLLKMISRTDPVINSVRRTPGAWYNFRGSDELLRLFVLNLKWQNSLHAYTIYMYFIGY